MSDLDLAVQIEQISKLQVKTFEHLNKIYDHLDKDMDNILYILEEIEKIKNRLNILN